MQKEIQEFLRSNQVASVCYVMDSLPNCFNCLYTTLPGADGIVFKSSGSSLHSRVMQNETPVAGTIYHASNSGLNNCGIQFIGRVAANEDIHAVAKTAYYKRFPMALVLPGHLFTIIFSSIKFSQTTNGIRHKVNWERGLCE